MRKLLIFLHTIILVFGIAKTSSAVLIDITDPFLPHFGDFFNQLPNLPNDFSNISKDPATEGDFGWHNSPSDGPSLSGILFGPDPYAVTTLRLQVHENPFKDFILQGSTNTTNGFDGIWTDLLSSSVTERTEREWQSWDFYNSDSYSAYRINALNDYKEPEKVLGWAMYRWELLADDGLGGPVIPEPSTILLLGSGFIGTLLRKKKLVNSFKKPERPALLALTKHKSTL